METVIENAKSNDFVIRRQRLRDEEYFKVKMVRMIEVLHSLSQDTERRKAFRRGSAHDQAKATTDAIQ